MPGWGAINEFLSIVLGLAVVYLTLPTFIEEQKRKRLPADERDREIILDSNRWPLTYVLPLKRFDEEHYGAQGYLEVEHRTRVFLGSFAAADLGGTLPNHLDYPSVQAMLDDGWRVD